MRYIIVKIQNKRLKFYKQEDVRKWRNSLEEATLFSNKSEEVESLARSVFGQIVTEIEAQKMKG